MSNDKATKRKGRPPADQSSIYRQAERFEKELRDLDEKREALLASIPQDVQDFMAYASKLRQRKPAAAAATPVEHAAPVPPALTEVKAPKANNKPNGANNGAAAHS